MDIHKNDFDGNLIYGSKNFHKLTNRIGKNKPSELEMVPEHQKIIKDSKKNRYRRKGKYWQKLTHCPVCGNSDILFKWERLGIEIFECQICSHGFQNPRITYKKAVELYSNDKTASNIYNSKIQIKLDRLKYQYGLNLINKFNKLSRENILDIGCGAGTFLRTAQKDGWKNCVGIDTNSNYKKNYSASPGINFLFTSFDKLNNSILENSFDVITMWNVLEHIYDLNDFIVQVKGLLKKKGLFFVMVPNYGSLATRIIRNLSPTFNWKHTQHFTIESLNYVMRKNNFQKISVETVISELGNVRNYLSGLNPYRPNKISDKIFEIISPDFIHSNYLGSRIIGIYRK